MPHPFHSRTVSLSLLFATSIGAGLAIWSSPASAPDELSRVTVELTANTWTPNRQVEPAIAADLDGNLLVAWSSRRQEDGAFGVYAQLLDPLGRAIGTEVHINQQIDGAQVSPAVAFDPGTGHAIVVWESTHQDGSGAGIVGRWFESSATGLHATTDEFAVNAERQGEQTLPSVSINADGQAMIAWTSERGDGSIAVARMIDRAGSAASDELHLGPVGAHSPIVAAGNNGFCVVGSAREPNGMPAALWMQRIDNNSTLHAPIAIAQTRGAQDIEPSLGVDAHGHAVVVWMRRGERGYNIMRRAFDAEGIAISPERVVATHTDKWLSGAAIAVAPDGRFVVSWNEEDQIAPAPVDGHRVSRASDVIAQRFDPDGDPLGAPSGLHQDAEGRQEMPIGAVASRSVWSATDQIAHVWHGRTSTDHRGVGVSLSYPEDLTAPAPIAFTPRPAVTPAMLETLNSEPQAAPVFDADFVPEPLDVNVRGAGPDFGFLGHQSTGWRPPDSEIAVGPDHVVAVVNARIVYRRKTDGVQTFAQDLTGGSGFWGGQGAGGFVFDPVAQYDIFSDRFVVAATERQGAQQYVNVAISDDSDPNGVWLKVRINVTSYGGGIDFPNMGVDENSIFITVDFFDGVPGNWAFIIDKADMIAGTLTMNAVRTSDGPRSLGAMTNYDTAPTAEYFATTYFGGSTQIGIRAITDPLGAPALHEFTLGVPTYKQPPGVDQLGSTNLVSTVDYRIKHGVVRNGSMWVAHNTNEPDGDGGPFSEDPIARVRWHEINLNGWPTSGSDPTLAQSGTLNYGVGIHTWFPGISVDDAGNAGIIFSRASADEFISVARAVRRATDPPGTFRQSVMMQTSTTPEPLDRWGDYAGIQEDPSEPGVFWGHTEYRTSAWRTWVGRFSPLTPNPLDFDLLSPSDSAVGESVDAVLDWEDAEDADNYDVAIATDPDLINTVAVNNVVGSSWTIPGGTLACDTQYYWGVIANGIGGSSVSTPGVFTFTTGLLADLNDDGIIDTADLGILIAEFGSADPAGDLNNDGIVDTADLGLLIAAFGQTCS